MYVVGGPKQTVERQKSLEDRKASVQHIRYISGRLKWTVQGKKGVGGRKDISAPQDMFWKIERDQCNIRKVLKNGKTTAQRKKGVRL